MSLTFQRYPHMSRDVHIWSYLLILCSDYLFMSCHGTVWSILNMCASIGTCYKITWFNKTDLFRSWVLYFNNTFHPLQSLLLLFPTFWSRGHEEVFYPIHVAATHGEGAATWGCLMWKTARCWIDFQGLIEWSSLETLEKDLPNTTIWIGAFSMDLYGFVILRCSRKGKRAYGQLLFYCFF